MAQRAGKIKFNECDIVNKYDRTSYLGQYKVVNGLPLNPKGRTGMIGRGLLGRYGPNHSGDPIVTRYVVVLELEYNAVQDGEWFATQP